MTNAAAVQHDVRVGGQLSPRAHEMTPERVAWYIETTGDGHPWYTGPSPFGGPVAPALLESNLAYQGSRLSEWYLPQRWGNLHQKQAWDLFTPAMVGETCESRGVVVERYARRGREFVVAETWLSAPDGRILSRCRSTQSFLPERREGIAVDKSKEARAERRFEPAEGPVLETLTGRRRPVTAEDCDRYVGDRRTYHNDAEEARKLGFDAVVVQGAYVTCFVAALLTERYGAGFLAGGRLALTFVNPLWAGEAATAGGIVREITQEGTGRRAHLDVWVAKDDGTRTIVGTASALE